MTEETRNKLSKAAKRRWAVAKREGVSRLSKSAPSRKSGLVFGAISGHRAVTLGSLIINGKFAREGGEQYISIPLSLLIE